MKNQIANYTVIINKEKRPGTKKMSYSAVVPTLGIATDADSFEDVQKAVRELVQFHVESLVEEGEEVPVESKDSFITKIEILLPKNTHVAIS